MSSQSDTSLNANRVDHIASLVKGSVGAVPLVGSLLAELLGTVIPNQRVDRLARFSDALDRRLRGLEAEHVRSKLNSEEVAELVEEAARQAVRSTSDARRDQIASLVACGIRAEEIDAIESRHLLRLLSELNDVEVIWLRAYFDPQLGGDAEFRNVHGEVLTPRVATMGSSRSDVDKSTMQTSYKEHLERLGLLKAKFKVDMKTKLPEFDRNGRQVRQGYEITSLGRLLLRHLNLVSAPAQV